MIYFETISVSNSLIIERQQKGTNTLDINILIKEAKKGNDDAFAELMDTCKEQLYRIAYSYLKSETDALEALQETTFRAYKNIKKLRKPEYFKTWLIRILINYCNDEIKRSRKYIAMEEHYISQVHDGDIYDSLALMDLIPAIYDLKNDYQEVIILRYFEDLKIKEIAYIKDIPEGTVKTKIHRALGELKSLLEGGQKSGY